MEQRRQKERAAEARQGELGTMLRNQSIGAARGQSDLRVECLRRQRADAAESHERFQDYQYTQAQSRRNLKQHMSDAEERLAAELKRRHDTAAREEAARRRIVEGSEELRLLKEKLHAAAVNKMRAQQLLDREVREAQAQAQEAALDAEVEVRRLEGLNFAARYEQEKTQQRGHVKETNQKQIAEKERQRQEAEELHVEDRAMVEMTVTKIAEEDRAERASRLQKQAEARRVFQQHQQQQLEKQQAEQLREAREDAKIEEYSKQKHDFKEVIARERGQQEVEKWRVQQLLIDQQVEKQREAEKMERLREELHFEEREEAARQNERVQAQKRLEDKAEMLRDYREQLLVKEEKRRRQAEEEQLFREQLMAKLAEDDRIEQMNAQKRRLRVQEHKREVDRQVEARREAYEAARQREREDEERAKEEEAWRRQVIEEERRRLLEEHAEPLTGFLPKGVFQKPDLPPSGADERRHARRTAGGWTTF